MVTKQSYLRTLNNTKRILTKRKLWTKSDDKYYQSLVRLISTDKQYWLHLSKLVGKYSLDKRGMDFKGGSEKACKLFYNKSTNFLKEKEKFESRFGNILYDYGLSRTLDAYGYPEMKSILNIEPLLYCLKCGMIFTNATVSNILEKGARSITDSFGRILKIQCPKCKSPDCRKHIRLCIDIFPETKSNDVIKSMKELPGILRSNHINAPEYFNKERYKPSGWKWIENLKKSVYGSVYKRTRANFERDRKWNDLYMKGWSYNKIARYTKENMNPIIFHLAAQRISDCGTGDETDYTDAKKYLDGKNYRITGQIIQGECSLSEEFKQNIDGIFSDIVLELPNIIRRAVNDFSINNHRN